MRKLLNKTGETLDLSSSSPACFPKDGAIQYRRLLSEHIRLVVLHPGLMKDPIQCQLVDTRRYFLSSALPYEALSYVWGPPEPAQAIFLGGVRFPVRQNLYDALLALRRKSKIRFLWIDALCINQADVQERNIEVDSMSQIFRSASKVLIWLGEGSEDSDFLLTLLSSGSSINGKKFLDEKILKGLVAFFQRPYWTRVWIIQEVMAASSLDICCGNKQIPLTCLSWALTEMEGISKKDKRKWSCINEQSIVDLSKVCFQTPGFAIVNARFSERMLKWESRWNISQAFDPEIPIAVLGQLLELCRQCNFQCEDPRDRIYGVVAMVNEVIGGKRRFYNFVPDYSKTMAQLYIDAFLFYIAAPDTEVTAAFGNLVLGSSDKIFFADRHIKSISTTRQLLDNPTWDQEKPGYIPLGRICSSSQRWKLTWVTDAIAAAFEGVGIISNIGINMTPSLWPSVQDAQQPGEEHGDNLQTASIHTKLSKLLILDYHRTQEIGVKYFSDKDPREFTTIYEKGSPIFSRESTGEFRLFKTKNGYIGISSVETRRGDLLCRIKNTNDTFLVIRPGEHVCGEETCVRQRRPLEFTIAGRAILILHGSDQISEDDFWGFFSCKYHVFEPRELICRLDAISLYALTR